MIIVPRYVVVNGSNGSWPADCASSRRCCTRSATSLLLLHWRGTSVNLAAHTHRLHLALATQRVRSKGMDGRSISGTPWPCTRAGHTHQRARAAHTHAHQDTHTQRRRTCSSVLARKACWGRKAVIRYDGRPARGISLGAAKSEEEETQNKFQKAKNGLGARGKIPRAPPTRNNIFCSSRVAFFEPGQHRLSQSSENDLMRGRRKAAGYLGTRAQQRKTTTTCGMHAACTARTARQEALRHHPAPPRVGFGSGRREMTYQTPPPQSICARGLAWVRHAVP